MRLYNRPLSKSGGFSGQERPGEGVRKRTQVHMKGHEDSKRGLFCRQGSKAGKIIGKEYMPLPLRQIH